MGCGVGGEVFATHGQMACIYAMAAPLKPAAKVNVEVKTMPASANWWFKRLAYP